MVHTLKNVFCDQNMSGFTEMVICILFTNIYGARGSVVD
jgi:hypothetical protein